MLHIVDIALDDQLAQTRLERLLLPDHMLLLTGASLAWPDTHPLLSRHQYRRLDDAMSDDALTELIRTHSPALSHHSDPEYKTHD